MAQPMQAGINERDWKGGVARPGKLAMSRKSRHGQYGLLSSRIWASEHPGSAPAARNTRNTMSINIIYCINPIIIITVLAKE